MRTTKLLLVAVGCLAAVVSSSEVERLIRDNNEHRLLGGLGGGGKHKIFLYNDFLLNFL
jgi:hypothetical protein